MESHLAFSFGLAFFPRRIFIPALAWIDGVFFFTAEHNGCVTVCSSVHLWVSVLNCCGCSCCAMYVVVVPYHSWSWGRVGFHSRHVLNSLGKSVRCFPQGPCHCILSARDSSGPCLQLCHVLLPFTMLTSAPVGIASPELVICTSWRIFRMLSGCACVFLGETSFISSAHLWSSRFDLVIEL
jgi:hypothetical protein